MNAYSIYSAIHQPLEQRSILIQKCGVSEGDIIVMFDFLCFPKTALIVAFEKFKNEIDSNSYRE